MVDLAPGLFLQECGAGTGQQGEWVLGLRRGSSGHPTRPGSTLGDPTARGSSSCRAASPGGVKPVLMRSRAVQLPGGLRCPGAAGLGRGPGRATPKEGMLGGQPQRPSSAPRGGVPPPHDGEMYQLTPLAVAMAGRGRACTNPSQSLGVMGGVGQGSWAGPGAVGVAGGHRVANAITTGQEVGPKANTASDGAQANAGRPCILLLSTPQPPGRGETQRPQTTGGREGKGQGCVPSRQPASLAGWRADCGCVAMPGGPVAGVHQSCLSPLCLQG